MKRTLNMLGGFLLAALPVAAGTPTWLHIAVDDGGAKATTVRVNLPLAVLQAVAPMANEQWMKNVRIEAGKHGLDKAQLRAMWTAAKSGGDSEFVRVREQDGDVRVARVGGRLVVRVDQGAREGGRRAEKVTVEIPGEVVDALIGGPGDQLDFVAALAALRRSGLSQLVAVDDGKSKVRIWIDDRNVSE